MLLNLRIVSTMTTVQRKKQDDNKKSIDALVARVAGAVQVAGITVGATMAIKDEALDDVEALRTASNIKTGDHAIKKIKTDTKRVLGKSK
jgi:hypothetical protein